MTVAIPQTLGRYEVLDELGRGAMGVVYLARDPVIHRLVALKTFHLGPEVEAAERKVFQDRFLMEARSCGRLNHPNIVTIHDVVDLTETQTAFMAMEYVRGSNLKQELRRSGTMGIEETKRVIGQVAAALDYAHAQGVVHRDVKPANILLTEEGQAKLTDFGIARLNTSNLTHDGQLIGTPNYMSPEQIRGVPVDHRADIFSLGVVLYEMLTRRKPFRAESLTAVTYRIVNEAFEPLQTSMLAIPDGLEEVLGKALAKKPEERFETAGELAKALEAIEETDPWDGEPPQLDALNDTRSLLQDTVVTPPPVPDAKSPAPRSPSPPPPPTAPAEPGVSPGPASAAPPPAAAAGQGAEGRDASGSGSGLSRSLSGLVDQTRSFLDRTVPPEARPPKRRVAVYVAAGLALLLIGLAVAQGVRMTLKPGAEETAATDRMRWSGELLELMRTGRGQLDTGDVQAALGTFQQARNLVESRQRAAQEEQRQAREAEDAARAATLSEELEDLEEKRLAVQAATLRAEWRREDLYAREAVAAGISEALEQARGAALRGDEEQVALWAVEALSLDPAQEEAQALLDEAEAGDIEPRIQRVRRAPPPDPEPLRRVAAARDGQETESPEEAVPARGRLVLDFVSDLPKGVLLLYVDEEQVLKESFRFYEKGGLFRRARARTGQLEKSFTVASGKHTLRVYVSGARNRPTEVRTFDMSLEPGDSRRLRVQVDEDGRVDASLE